MAKIQIENLKFVNDESDLTTEQTSQILGGRSLTPGEAATCTLFGGAVAAAGGGPLGGAAAAAGCILILGSDSTGGAGANIGDIIGA